MQLYWQAKIWGLLHDPIFKPLLMGKSGEGSILRRLAVLSDVNGNPALEAYLKNADYIASASDRAAISSFDDYVNYGATGLEISHLLSGEKQQWQISDRAKLIAPNTEAELFPAWIETELDARKVFWWLWRCLPTAACMASNDENKASLLLMPADTRIPDTSLWSHTSMTAALAGALIGYDTTMAEFQAIDPEKLRYNAYSHPYLVSFTFTPVQELIKASRKMRDFWAGSWILHYVSAHVSWKLACKYGADSLLYPSLFNQPLIDLWLLKEYDFKAWIKPPSTDSLLTAGFPNVLVLVLPKEKVAAAMQFAEQELKEVWKDLGNKVFDVLGESEWLRELQKDSSIWNGWLDTQWQTYWTGVPIGVKGKSIKQKNNEYLAKWISIQNKINGLRDPDLTLTFEQNKQINNNGLFQATELELLSKYAANIGSWWGYIFDTARLNLGAVKNARTWQLPTVYSTRSTVSGIGAAVYPSGQNDWANEQDVKDFWKQPHANLFNGSEQLNASEVIKRGLHQILPDLLGVAERDLSLAYPDLTSGVAGYLNKYPDKRDRYIEACQNIQAKLEDEHLKSNDIKWGIPWAEAQAELKHYPPRLLNAGWLVDDLTKDKRSLEITEKSELRIELDREIGKFYPSNNPTDWYVLAAGDGDGMSDWLKGTNMQPYREYIPKSLEVTAGDNFDKFLDIPKRMGPSTHNALSRALLDFSNRLLPYLTQQRYAGRLIYGGGDDVLAYTNLWEWDRWVWDVRQCFRGAEDEGGEFGNAGDYWQWLGDKPPEGFKRPLFTMGQKATISFGMTIAHQSTPMAIALEQLWEAEASAKEHLAPPKDGKKQVKDAIEIRVIYSNGNILKATTKFAAFKQWQKLIDRHQDLKDNGAIFEQAAIVWNNHPAPIIEAIEPWCLAFVDRREMFTGDDDRKEPFRKDLQAFIHIMHEFNLAEDIDSQIGNWLKLAAFTIRRRKIELGGAA